MSDLIETKKEDRPLVTFALFSYNCLIEKNRILAC